MKRTFKENKNFIIGCIFIIGIIFLIGLKMSFSTSESTYLRNQNVDGLSFENANLKQNEDGTYTFTVDVYNENKKTYNLKYINMIFKDQDGSETVLVGYIGESLESDEGRVITAITDKNIYNSLSLTYSIQK